jgi:hypothetical protein
VFSFAVAIEEAATIPRDCEGDGEFQPELW